jgi:hypothetical protein
VTSRGDAPLAVAFGGGGAFGIAFQLGFARGLASEGVSLTGHPMIGVSAGSWTAAAMATSTPVEAVVEVWTDSARLHGDRPADVMSAATAVFGSAVAEEVSGVAVRLPSARRVVLRGADHVLAQIVTASSSPPYLAAPYRLDGQRVYDAGVVYNTCADLAPRARTLLVLAPLGIGALGWQGLIWESRLLSEIAMWRLRWRGQVVLVRPSVELARMASATWRDLLDGHLMAATYAAAYEDGQRRAAALGCRLLRADAPSPAAFVSLPERPAKAWKYLQRVVPVELSRATRRQ